MATETATETSSAQAQVRIHLQSRSQDEALQLPETGPILVSTELRRYQLSTLVNRLLETERAIPLEFLINGQFLRTSLDEFLTQNGISAETTLNVEYVKALIPPLHVASYEHDDWVSSVDVLSKSSPAAKWAGSRHEGNINDRILSGSYDGTVRVWNMSSEVTATGEGHTSAVRAVKFISPTQILSAGFDRTLRLWKFDDSATGQGFLTPTLELYGHESHISKVAVHAPSARVLSASANRSIGLWSTRKNEAPAAPEQLLPSAGGTTSNKRRKISSSAGASGNPPPQRGPLGQLKGHSAQVSDVCFDERDPTVAYSSSWDHSVRTWDLATQRSVDTRTTAHSLFSVLHLPSSGLVAAGSSARHISLVDPRASATQVSAMTLRGHRNAVVSLSASPEQGNAHQLVSGSHDGTCRIWDLRSVRQEAETRVGEAVYVIERESMRGQQPLSGVPGDGAKVLGVCWNQDVGIVSGGEDKKVQINKGSA